VRNQQDEAAASLRSQGSLVFVDLGSSQFRQLAADRSHKVAFKSTKNSTGMIPLEPRHGFSV
jgi:hypothetical protein